MTARFVTLLVLAGIIACGPVYAQLGPKDGMNLPATEIDRVKVGQLAPDFSLEDADGRTITLADFRGKKSVVLVFYRGYW